MDPLNFPAELVRLYEARQTAQDIYTALHGTLRPEGSAQGIVYDMQCEAALDDLVDADRRYKAELKLHMAAKQMMRLPADEVAS
jgi:hypothetical protein